jgi:hypothetical protein
MTVVPEESLIGLMADTRGEVHARPGGLFNAARTSARLGHQTRFLGRFSTGPPQPDPDRQAHPGRRRGDIARTRRKAHGTSRRQRHRPLIFDRTAREISKWHR